MKMNKIFSIMIGVFLLFGSFFAVAAPEFGTISVSLLSQDPDPVAPGDQFDVRLKVENIGRDNLDNVMFEAIVEYPFALEPGDDGTRELGTLYGGQIGEDAYVLRYKLLTQADANGGDYEFRVRYSTDNGDNWRRVDPFTLHVESSDAIIGVKEVKTTPQLVGIGEEVTMQITLENLADSFVKNVRVNLGLSDTTGTTATPLPFAPVGSSNEKVIKQMNSKTKSAVTFTLASDATASPGVYKFPLTITYESEDGETQTKNEVVSVKVGEEPNLLITVDNGKPFIVDKEAMLDVRFTNRGLVDVKLVTVMVEESEAFELMTSDTVYVGNIDSDDYESAEFTLKAKKVENNKFDVPLTIEYLDANNQKYTTQKTLSVSAVSLTEATESGLVQKNNSMGIIVVVAIVVVGFILYRIFRKKKK